MTHLPIVWRLACLAPLAIVAAICTAWATGAGVRAGHAKGGAMVIREFLQNMPALFWLFAAWGYLIGFTLASGTPFIVTAAVLVWAAYKSLHLIGSVNNDS